MIAPRAGEDGCSPHLIIAHSDPSYVAQVSRCFRQLGWRVHSAESGPAARRAARTLAPAGVVLAIDLPNESGWLTCAKLTAEQPGLKVLLVTTTPTSEYYRFADFVGAAALVCKSNGMQVLLDELADAALPAAG
jgi:DNA-binding response OmpR family regulator